MSSEVERLVELGDVDAILDELHQYRTEWDDAREALDRLVGKAAGEARDEAARLRSQLARHLTAWRHAARRAAERRTENTDLLRSMDRLNARLQRHMDDKNAADARFTNQYSQVHLERDNLRGELADARAHRAEAVERLLADLSRCRTEHLRVKEDGAKGWAKAKELQVEVERLRTEMRERAEDEAYALNRFHDARGALIRELRASSRFRKAWQSARRGRAEERQRADALHAERERLRTELANMRAFAQDGHALAEQASALHRDARTVVERVRARHRGVCTGACGLDDGCECDERDLACEECSAPYPCDTRRDLDGTAPAEPTGPREVQCPHCGDWSDLPAGMDTCGLWCEECGAHMDGAPKTRPVAAGQPAQVKEETRG